MRSLILIVLAALAGTAVIADTAASQADYVPKQYQPKSKRDFTGIWHNKDGVGFTPGVPPGRMQKAPLTPEYQKIFDKRLADAEAGKPTGDLGADCLPSGMPRIMNMVFPMEIMQNETQLNIFAEYQEQTRRIFVDGRPHTPKDEIESTYNGESVGRWEGDVLVAETIGIRAGVIEGSNMPHSDQLIVKERIWLADNNTLKDAITLIDPEALTRPWTVTKTYHRAAAGFKLLPYVCAENNRNRIDEQGVTGFSFEQAPRTESEKNPR